MLIASVSKKKKEPIFKQGNALKATVVSVICNPKPVKTKTWTAPANGWIKINVDTSVEINNGSCSIACISRDHHGNVLWARNATNLKCQDVPEAEAKACLLGMQSITDARNASIILESDNSMVVEGIKRRNQGHSRL
jgi:hypothetical protein